MKTFFLILFSCALLVLVFALLFKKEKRALKSARFKSSHQSSDIILRGKNEGVKIILRTSQNKKTDEQTIQAEIYVKNKPICYAGSPLLFEIGTFNGKFPTPQKILKKIYFLASSTDFLSHPFSSHFKIDLLSRIYKIRSRNIQNKILDAVYSFNPPLYNKLKKQQETEQKMAELLLAQTNQFEKLMQEERLKYQTSSSNSDTANAQTKIDLSAEEMVNILPSDEIKKYQSSHKDIENESSVNISPENKAPYFQISDKAGRS